MKLNIILFLILGTSLNCMGQNLNMILEINGEIATSKISGFYLNFEYENGTKDKILVNYNPGELLLKEDSWKKIKADSTTKITLSFQYTTFKKNEVVANTKNIKSEMKKSYFEQPYLILRVYDFRERKYRKKYGCLTDKEYVTEFNYPRGGILISCK